MSSSEISMSMKPQDGVKSAFNLVTRVPAKTASANRMYNFTSLPKKKSQESLIDEALEIVNSPESTSKESITARRESATSIRRSRSSLSLRRTSELLSDNSDRLSELMRTPYSNAEDFDDSDYDSDLED
ncbi:MAG: hypothetical protein SGBAC_007149 [Bacillariaceae sp.]